MIAGAPLSFWLGFHLVVAAILLVDLVALNRKLRLRVAILWMTFLVALALGFCAFLFRSQGKQPALEFLAGYVIEGSLSIDNLFVFVLLFRAFALKEAGQRKALHWGVLGAIVLRAAFIVGGVTMLERFRALEYVFGAVLLYAAARVAREKERKDKPPLALRWLGFRQGRSPLALAVVAIEFTDLIFAVDSVPAVLAVTHDVFVAYTSNIFAILGLRSLYFVLSGLLDRLRLLHYGLALVLAFVGLKMLLGRWIAIPTGWSLAIIVLILALFTALSLRPLSPAPRARAQRS